MTTTTVYIPVALKTETEITQAQACDIASAISSMIRSGFYCIDNVYDAATECGVELNDVTVKPAISDLNTKEPNNA